MVGIASPRDASIATVAERHYKAEAKSRRWRDRDVGILLTRVGLGTRSFSLRCLVKAGARTRDIVRRTAWEASMRPNLILISGVAAIVGIAASADTVCSQGLQLAPEGRGVLAKPAETPSTLGGTPPPHPFVRDPSGWFSATIFETQENPDFNIIIRDFSFPPDKQNHTITLPSAAFVHLLSGSGTISVAKKQVDLRSVARTAVPTSAPIDVVNNTEYPVVIRALIVESK